MGSSHRPGKRLELRWLLADHPAAFTYEVRRGGFRLAEIDSIPEEMFAFVMGAIADPGSQLNTAIQGWKHPLSYEGFLLMDLIDLMGQANSKKGAWKRWPRPLKNDGTKHTEKVGHTTLGPDEARRLLRRNAGRGT